MFRNKVLLGGLIVLLVVTALLWWHNRYVGTSRPFEAASQPSQEPTTDSAQAIHSASAEYRQLSLKGLSRKEAIRIFNQNTKRDSRYEWEIPIRFYGKVIDQHGSPVADSTVKLQWVNLEGEDGASEAYLTTNAEGLFTFEGVKGKRLLVLEITKDGYHQMNPKANQTSFEFANPAETIFYEPDPSNPVTLLIRKKGEAQPLIMKSVEVVLRGQGATGTVDLLTGEVSTSAGQLHVTVWKPTITTEQINTGKVFPYQWRVRIRINSGGLAEHKDAFPFEAPESGYVTEYDATLRPSDGASADVTVNKEFYFYFGQPRKYGRLHFRTDGDRPYVFINYWLNPSGSRSLEYDASEDDS
jgi:hypothetical protein